MYKIQGKIQPELTIGIQVYDNEQFIESINSFRKECSTLITNEKIALENIINFEQTSVYLENMPNKFILPKGSKVTKVQTLGNESKRASLLLTVSASGQKFPPFVIFKATPNRRIKQDFIKLNKQQKAIYCTTQNNAWAYSDFFSEQKDFLLDQLPKNQKCLILCDSYSIRKYKGEDAIKEKRPNYFIKFLPAYSTPIIQPLDIGVNCVFKNKLRTKWVFQQEEQNFRETLIEDIKSS